MNDLLTGSLHSMLEGTNAVDFLEGFVIQLMMCWGLFTARQRPNLPDKEMVRAIGSCSLFASFPIRRHGICTTLHAY